MEVWDEINEYMTDAGCSQKLIKQAELFYETGEFDELIRWLRSRRSDTLLMIHEKQRQLDRLDILIRSLRKSKEYLS